ncbi:MAG TPA: chromate transporter [Gemmataceae bacterium]|nr:chromate transporter [Gemmataceae bacterium]
MRLIAFLLRVCAYNALAFGNGTVMVPLVKKSFVENQQLLTEQQLLYAFAIAQVLPGQANLYVASMGYMVFGLGAAFLAITVVNVPGYLMLPLAAWYGRVRDLWLIKNSIRGLTAASVGLVFAATADVGRHALTRPAGWVAFLLTLAFAHLLRWNALVSLVLASGVALLVRVWMG